MTPAEVHAIAMDAVAGALVEAGKMCRQLGLPDEVAAAALLEAAVREQLQHAGPELAGLRLRAVADAIGAGHPAPWQAAIRLDCAGSA